MSLIGGGPGDPELITVRGHRLLRAADVILYDRLAPVALIEELDHAEGPLLVDVGKTPGNHPMPQTEINDLIVSHALAGRRVARLKGGDPFVFGRGTEEALSALEHGLPVEVVPGITAGLAVPAAAGVPVTSRGQARAVLLLSGHDGAESVVARTHGTPADTTLVLYMGVRHLREVATALIEAGRPADLPVAVISSGLTHSQRTVVGTLATIADAAADQRAPAITVIGEVAALSEELGTLVPPPPMPATRTDTPGPGSILLAHGSPDDRHRMAIELLAARVQSITARPTTAAFLQHHGPTCSQAVSRLVTAGVAGGAVRVLPLLPSAGEHAQDDVGPATAGTGATVLPAVDAARLADPVVGAIRAVQPRPSGRVVLLAPGSRRSDPSVAFAGLSQLLGRALGEHIEIVDRPANLPLEVGIGIVVPVIWAPGRLWDRLDARVSGTSIVPTPPLALIPGTAEALATLVSGR